MTWGSFVQDRRPIHPLEVACDPTRFPFDLRQHHSGGHQAAAEVPDREHGAGPANLPSVSVSSALRLQCSQLFLATTEMTGERPRRVSATLLIVGVLGHVGATLVVATMEITQLAKGRVGFSIAVSADAGVSYGLAAVAGILVARVPATWRRRCLWPA